MMQDRGNAYRRRRPDDSDSQAYSQVAPTLESTAVSNALTAPEAVSSFTRNPGGSTALPGASSPVAGAGVGSTVSAPQGTVASPGGSHTGWGYNTPSGGRSEFSYTPGSYSGGFDSLEGFNHDKLSFDHPDSSSLKYVFARATQGLQPSSENLDEIVRRLQAQGMAGVRRHDHDKIDFGMGEGPMDVIRGGTPETGYHGWQWLLAGGGAPGMAGGAAGAGGTSPLVGGTPLGGGTLPGTTTPDDPNEQLRLLLQQLLKDEPKEPLPTNGPVSRY